METLKVKIKRMDEDAVIPTYAHATDAGMDLVATSKAIGKDGIVIYGTGIAVEIPKGYVGLVFPRSSNCKKDLLLTNSVGVIDSGYRGEITFKYVPTSSLVVFHNLADRLKLVLHREFSLSIIGSPVYRLHGKEYNIGDRVGQLIIIPYPKVEFEEVGELSDSDRCANGYGSTGK
nr:MAG TPA: dUTPase [Caudoviricetes sp.]